MYRLFRWLLLSTIKRMSTKKSWITWNSGGESIFIVRSCWYWCLYPVRSVRCPVPGTVCPVPGTACPVPDTVCPVVCICLCCLSTDVQFRSRRPRLEAACCLRLSPSGRAEYMMELFDSKSYCLLHHTGFCTIRSALVSYTSATQVLLWCYTSSTLALACT